MLRIKKNQSDQFNIKFSNWFSALIQLIKPRNLFVVGGRGLAKTTDIISNRTIDVADSMPRAPLVFVSDTYVNILTNIIPYVIEGWQRAGEVEGYHFVVDRKPPDSFEKPVVFTTGYKHTIIRRNGTKFFLKSLDRPSVNAGISAVHHFGDEAKYLKKDKLNKMFPTLRGDAAMYKNSHYFMGQTYLTDMPNNNNNGEDDWILDLEHLMDVEQIKRIINVSAVYNEELLNFELLKNNSEKVNQKRLIERWEERLNKIRRNSTFFYKVSSFANADILTADYFSNLYNILGKEEFTRAVMSIEGKKVTNLFYFKLESRHFYLDGYDYNYYDRFELGSNIQKNSHGLRYCQHDQPLYCGVDFGNMISMLVFQEQGNTYRVLKEFWTIPPLWLDDIANDFVNYFEKHKIKLLYMRYDRSGNNYHRSRQDIATQLKQKIEQTGKGWTVILQSIGQGNIGQDVEYELMNEMLAETNPRLPKIRIDQNECPCYKSSIELAETKKINNIIKKDKSSEKTKDLTKLPMYSTNMSDAGKYAFCTDKNKLQMKGIPMSIGNVSLF